MSCAGSAEWACVSSAQSCRGAMAAPRGEALGYRDHGSPRGAVAGERQRFPAPVGGRAFSAPAGCGAAGPG